MSLPTVAAARVYKNQQKALQNEHQDDDTTNILADYDGNSEKLVWEKFPHTGLSMVRIFMMTTFLE